MTCDHIATFQLASLINFKKTHVFIWTISSCFTVFRGHRIGALVAAQNKTDENMGSLCYLNRKNRVQSFTFGTDTLALLFSLFRKIRYIMCSSNNFPDRSLMILTHEFSSSFTSDVILILDLYVAHEPMMPALVSLTTEMGYTSNSTPS